MSRQPEHWSCQPGEYDVSSMRVIQMLVSATGDTFPDSVTVPPSNHFNNSGNSGASLALWLWLPNGPTATKVLSPERHGPCPMNCADGRGSAGVSGAAPGQAKPRQWSAGTAFLNKRLSNAQSHGNGARNAADSGMMAAWYCRMWW
jgi:hypothetical protein